MQAIKLIPPSFEISPVIQAVDQLVTAIDVKATPDLIPGTERLSAVDLLITLENETRWDKNNAQVNIDPVLAWGYLELICRLTGRSARFLMPCVEGYTVQTINQNDLVGNFAHPLCRIVTLRQIDEYYVVGEKVFEDRKETSFSKEYTTLRLMQTNEDETVSIVHTFWEGKARQDLIGELTGD